MSSTNIKSVVTNRNRVIKSRVTTNRDFVVTNYATTAIPTSSTALESAINVDAGSLQDGSVLLYNGERQIWETKPTVSNTNTRFDGGNF